MYIFVYLRDRMKIELAAGIQARGIRSETRERCSGPVSSRAVDSFGAARAGGRGGAGAAAVGVSPGGAYRVHL